MDMWTGDVFLGMLIFGDVYNCSTWTVHTYTRPLHTNDTHLTWTRIWTSDMLELLQYNATTVSAKFLQNQRGNFQLGNPTPPGHTSKYSRTLHLMDQRDSV